MVLNVSIRCGGVFWVFLSSFFLFLFFFYRRMFVIKLSLKLIVIIIHSFKICNLD